MAVPQSVLHGFDMSDCSGGETKRTPPTLALFQHQKEVSNEML